MTPWRRDSSWRAPAPVRGPAERSALILRCAARATAILTLTAAGFAAEPIPPQTPPAADRDAPRVAASEGGALLDTITVIPSPDAGSFQPMARWRAPGRPTLALALSGGAARGLAHLGVLEALEEDGVEPDAIAGTSIGALLGAFIAVGYSPADVVQILKGRDWESIVFGLDLRNRVLSDSEDVRQTSALVDIRLRRGRQLQVGALLEGRLLKRELYRYFLKGQLDSDGDFDHLRLRYRPVATDIQSGKPVIPSSGDLVSYVRGSFAIPGVFRPVPVDDHLLVDGGLVENVPVRAAKSFGADAVLAVDVTETLDPEKQVRGALALVNRSLALVMATTTRESLALADVVVTPAVAPFSSANFTGHLEELVQAGRAAYAQQREAIWKILEARSKHRAPIDYAAIEVRGTALIDRAELASRLGGASGTVSRFRVEAELARALNLGPFASGRVEWRAAPGGKLLRFIFEETTAPPGTAAAPGAAAFVEGAAAPGSAALQATASDAGTRPPPELLTEEKEIGRIVTETKGEIRLEVTQRFLADLQGKAFDFDRLADRLDEMVARGAIFDWTLQARRMPDGRIELHVLVRGDDYWEGSFGGAFRGEMSWAGYLRLAKANITGRGDFVDLTLLGARETTLVRARYRTEYGIGPQNLGAEAGLDHYDNSYPLVDANQHLLEQTEDYRGDRLWASLIGRLRWGAVAQLGLAHQRDRLEATATLPAESIRRASAFLRIGLDRHDRLLFPTRGSSVTVLAEDSFSGDTLWKTEMKADTALSVGASKGQTISLLLGAGLSENALRRPYWFNPGGYRELYGFLPYGAAAPQYARIGATWRLRLFDLGAARIYLETGANVIRTAFQRGDLGAANDQVGYGLSLIAHTRLLGPIALGAARNDNGAGMLFLTAGFPFLNN